MKLIVAGGMHGSGSTWLYNVLRYAHLHAGQSVYGDFVDNYEPTTPAEVHVVKMHVPHKPLCAQASAILVSYRDVRDCIASLVRRDRAECAVEPEALGEWAGRLIAQEYDDWQPYVQRWVRYEDMRRDERSAIAGVLQQVGLAGQVYPWAVESDVNRLRQIVVPDRDRMTQLWPRHCGSGESGGYREILTPEMVKAIETAAGDWLREHGYAVD